MLMRDRRSRSRTVGVDVAIVNQRKVIRARLQTIQARVRAPNQVALICIIVFYRV